MENYGTISVCLFFLELCAESQCVKTRRHALVSVWLFFLELRAELHYVETRRRCFRKPYKCTPGFS